MPSSLTTGIAFEVAAASMPRNSAEPLDRRHAGRLDLLGRVEPLGEDGLARDRRARSRDRPRSRRSRSGRACSRRSPRGRGSRSLNLPPMIPLSAWTSYASRPQRSKIRWYASRFASKLAVDAFLVAVERVRVLHDELADAEEAAARARLVAVLGLRSGTRAAAARLYDSDLARVEGHRLLVRHRQDEVGGPLRSCSVEDLRDLDRGRSSPRAPPA